MVITPASPVATANCGVETNAFDCCACTRMAWTAFITSPGWL
jgi:hypothetical protein